ncbi:hypothetical protein F4679DRAFT_596222 [Xylaria curta]|nr:hypothetical protein F4679DRAFT_596222 [Xylaria curta]
MTITMDFVPDPAAVHDYMDRYRHCAFVLTLLPTSVRQETIDNALRFTPFCAGNATVYWPKLDRTNPLQQHRGWCHVLCTTQDFKNILEGVLNGYKLRPRSGPCATKRTKYPIQEFERISRIPVSRLEIVSLAAPSAAAPNVPASAPADTTVTTPVDATATASATTTAAIVPIIVPIATVAAAETIDNAADEDEEVVPAYPSWQEYQYAYDAVYEARQRLDFNTTATPTRDIFQQMAEAVDVTEKALDAAKEVLQATLACKRDEPDVPAEAER